MWDIDDIIMRSWETKGAKDKRDLELRCYQEFKASNYDLTMIDYLRENNCNDLADEIERIAKVHKKTPHQHDKRYAA
jgi:hypothetical protein